MENFIFYAVLILHYNKTSDQITQRSLQYAVEFSPVFTKIIYAKSQ